MREFSQNDGKIAPQTPQNGDFRLRRPGGLNHHQVFCLATTRGFGFWYQLALDKRFLLAHETPSIAHPFVAGWVFAFLVLLSCAGGAGGAGARCAASSLSLSSRQCPKRLAFLPEQPEQPEQNGNNPTENGRISRITCLDQRI